MTPLAPSHAAWRVRGTSDWSPLVQVGRLTRGDPRSGAAGGGDVAVVASRPVRARPSSRSPGASGTVELEAADEGDGVGVDVAAELPLPLPAAPRARHGDGGVGDGAAQVVDDVDVEGELVAWAQHRRQRVGDDDDRPAGVDDGLPGELRRPPVVEHRCRDHRRRVGEPREAEPAGRPVLQPAQRLDVVAQDRRLVALRRRAPRVERRVLVGRDALRPSPRPRARGARAAPPSRAPASATRRRTRRPVGDRLGAELADEADEAGHRAGPARPARRPRRGASRATCASRCRRAAAGAARRRRGRRSGGSGRPARTTASPSGRGRTCSTSAAAAATKRRRRLDRRSVSTCGASAIGSSWAHHCTIDGWWPSESTASRAWRTASLRIWRA